ncbi:MAG: hypothetical protein OEZ13_01755 [Spirochaetia bacterium]|nr:hypothetical protein [Spirochaetia bacterium]
MKITKITVLLLITVFALSMTPAEARKKRKSKATQENTSSSLFHKSDFIVGISGALASYGETGYSARINAEYGLTNNIGLGGYLGYGTYSEEMTYLALAADVNYQIYTLGATFNYHLNFIKISKLDLFAGADLGYNIVSFTATDTQTQPGLSLANALEIDGNGLEFGIYGGMHYFLSNNLALRAKIGFGVSILELGVDYIL